MYVCMYICIYIAMLSLYKWHRIKKPVLVACYGKYLGRYTDIHVKVKWNPPPSKIITRKVSPSSKFILWRLSRNSPPFTETEGYYRFHKNPPLDSILNQLNPIRFLILHVLRNNFNIIIPSTSRLSQVVSSFQVYQTKIFFLMHSTSSVHLFLLGMLSPTTMAKNWN